MSRIFFPLALFAVLAMSAVMLLGLELRGRDVRDAKDVATQRLATVHRLTGIGAGLCVLLVNSVVITYFVGTSRWCKEVSETYRLDASFTARSARLKRRTFPISVASMLVVVGLTALGGAADPASHMAPPPLQVFGETSWADVHMIGALLGIALVAYGFYAQSRQIAANQVVIQDVMIEVARIRAERGLDKATA